MFASLSLVEFPFYGPTRYYDVHHRLVRHVIK
jgi:hypothetical protein